MQVLQAKKNASAPTISINLRQAQFTNLQHEIKLYLNKNHWFIYGINP